jgi:uncharacterized protein with PIN domain
MSENNAKKFVTIEMFEQYHKKLVEHIGMLDDLMLNGFTICPKCGATITSDKCDECNINEKQRMGEFSDCFNDI